MSKRRRGRGKGKRSDQKQHPVRGRNAGRREAASNRGDRLPAPTKFVGTANLPRPYLTLDAISRLVDRFHTRAISGAEEEVEGAFLNFCQNALRICSRTLFEGAYEADIIECDPTGRLKLICASSAESHQWFPDMSITWGPDKKIVEPDAKSGVAAYCFYANVQLGWTGYAVAPNLPQRNIVFQRLGLAEDYPPHSVREVYKDPPTPGG